MSRRRRMDYLHAHTHSHTMRRERSIRREAGGIPGRLRGGRGGCGCLWLLMAGCVQGSQLLLTTILGRARQGMVS